MSHPSHISRTALVGRVKMAKAMEMPESDWALTLAGVEEDPLFLELLSPFDGKPILQHKRLGAAGLSTRFYEAVSVSAHANAAKAADHKRLLMAMAGRMGRAEFEQSVIHRIGAGAALPDDAHTAVLTVAAATDAFYPSSVSTAASPVSVIGHVDAAADGSFGFSFFSPHMARGLYEIDRDRLKRWQDQRALGRDGVSRLRHLVSVLDLFNMKQAAFWRVLDRLLGLNREFFVSRDAAVMAPVSLRKLAAQLDFAPSTVSRVVSGKSILLPWGQEVLISDLMPGQRRVVLSILEKVLPHMPSASDMMIARWLKEHHAITVSRRTITACRHLIQAAHRQQKAA